MRPLNVALLTLACCSVAGTCVSQTTDVRRPNPPAVAAAVVVHADNSVTLVQHTIAPARDSRLQGAAAVTQDDLRSVAAACVEKASAAAAAAAGESAPNVAAWGGFRDEVNTIGWSVLNVHSNESSTNTDQAYAAGYLEGHLTQLRIWQRGVNNGVKTTTLSKAVQGFLSANAKWMAQQVMANPSSDYWVQVGLTLRQLDGMFDGYSKAAPADQQLTRDEFNLFTYSGDIETLATALDGVPVGIDAPPSEVGTRESHCSALVKLTADNAELFAAQDTWASFTSMLRIYKLYDLPYASVEKPGTIVPGRFISHSSYPGNIFSGDDHYAIAPSNLVVMETTIGNSNADLWSAGIKPESVLEWVRNMVANRLASSGQEWSTTFAAHNNGCYNNEFMVVDYKLFAPGSPPKAGALWILEQIPTYVEYHDMTATLVQQGYWPSFNIAQFPRVYNLSGMPAVEKQYGSFFSPTGSPRAQIFKARHHTVTDLKSMQALMRQDDFEHDPMSRCDCTPPYSSENSIACRGDLNPADGKYPFGALAQRNHAATDTKIASHAMMQGTDGDGVPTVNAISSPTYQSLPVFVWSTSPYANVSHVGHPDRWDFDFVDMAFSAKLSNVRV